MEHTRPEIYNYMDQLKEYLGGDLSKVFNGELVYPRQLEIHLPGNGKIPCNFHCDHCQGRLLKQPLGNWEEDGLILLEKLKGQVPYHIYGGAYSEPMINSYMLGYLKVTKKYDNNFGIHTNGSMLVKLEEEENFLRIANDISTSLLDYISISLDGGDAESHAKVKKVDGVFERIMEGLRIAAKYRGERAYPSLRIVYLLNELNSSDETIANIVRLSKEIGVDSLRFSIPYDNYGKDFKVVREYKRSVENVYDSIYYSRVEKYLTDQGSKPFIFWMPPITQDVDRMKFAQCIYSYFQITLGADGWMYKCSSTASPSFPFCRLGKITSDLNKFNKMVIKNHNPSWIPQTCFNARARCNRMGLELNNEWEERNE